MHAVGRQMLQSNSLMHHHRRQYSDHFMDVSSKWLQSTNLSQDFKLHVREVNMHMEASKENHLNVKHCEHACGGQRRESWGEHMQGNVKDKEKE
ncbi:hypothetical protein ACFX1T_032336 [Malus domestica]